MTRGPVRAVTDGSAALWCVVLAAAVLVPGGLFRFPEAKLLVLAAAVSLAAAAVQRGAVVRPVVGLVVVGAAVLAVAAATSAAPLAQLLGRWPRFEGLVALPVYVGVVWLGARLLGPAAPDRSVRTLRDATAVLALLVAVVAVPEAVGLRPLGGPDGARTGSLLGSATDQGVVGALALGVLLVPALRTRRPLLVAGCAAGAVDVALSGSRAAVLAALVTVLALAVLAGVDGRPGRAGVLLGAAGVVVVGSLLVPATRARVVGGDELAASTVTGRELLWRESLDLAGRAPVTGVGPSGFVDALPDVHGERWALQVGSANPPDSPHAWPLQALLAGGIPLLLLAAALAGTVGVLGVRRWRSAGSDDHRDLAGAALAGLAGYAVALGTHFTTAGNVGLAAVLAGVLVAAPPRPPRLPATVRTAAAAVVCAVWVLGLLGGVASQWVLQSATDLALAGSTAEADARFRTAAALRPWDRDVALVAAQVHVAGATAGDVDSARSAETWARLALSRTPDSIDAGRILGVALTTEGDPAQAVVVLDPLLGRDPRDSALLLARGVARARSGSLPGAEADLLDAARYAPSDPTPWQDLAIIYDATGRTALADDARAKAAERP